MFNHARTLLVNLGGNVAARDYLGEELIPASFKPVVLPAYLQRIRQVLFGSDPDRYMLNYRSRQLLQLLHSSELAEYVLALDPRITYTPRSTGWDWDPAVFTPVVTTVTGGPLTIPLTQPAAPDQSGRLYYEFTVTNVSDDHLVVTQRTPPPQQRSTTLEFTNGSSQLVPLAATGYSCRVDSGNPGSWRVNLYLRPQFDLGQLAADLHSVGDPALTALFGTAKYQPYYTFHNCWRDNAELPYRLGGLVLALIYRTEEFRRVQS